MNRNSFFLELLAVVVLTILLAHFIGPVKAAALITGYFAFKRRRPRNYTARTRNFKFDFDAKIFHLRMEIDLGTISARNLTKI